MKKLDSIAFLTKNAAKIRLANQRLNKYGLKVYGRPLDFSENQEMNVEKVALDKAKQLADKIIEEFIIEDSALYINSLNGFPGTFLKQVFDTLGEEKICQLVKNEKDKTAFVKSVLVYTNPKKNILKTFTGIYEGKIANNPKGNSLRGWRILRVFISKGSNKTLAQLSDFEWDKFIKEFENDDHYEQFGKWYRQQKEQELMAI